MVLHTIELTVGQGTTGEADSHDRQRGIEPILGLQPMGNHGHDGVTDSVGQILPGVVFYHPGGWEDDLGMQNEDNVQNILHSLVNIS